MSLASLKPISGPARRKQSAVISALLGLARKLGPGAKLPTTRELAKALGITGATLTKCLENLESRGVLRCLQGSGIYVEKGVLERRIGLVFGYNIFAEEESAFGGQLLRNCANRAAEHHEYFSFFLDLPVMTGLMNGTEVPAHQDLSDALKNGRLNGLILVGRNSIEQEKWLRSQGVPVASAEARLGAVSKVPGIVCFDYEQLILQGLERLKRAGCQQVGLLAVLQEHVEMFRRGLQKLGLSTSENWIYSPPTEEPIAHDERKAFHTHIANEFLTRNGWGKSKNSLPEGLLITDDHMTAEVCSVLAQRKVTLGEDLIICSQANKGASTLDKLNVLKVEFDPQDMAAALFDVLEMLMDGDTPPNSPHLLAPVPLMEVASEKETPRRQGSSNISKLEKLAIHTSIDSISDPTRWFAKTLTAELQDILQSRGIESQIWVDSRAPELRNSTWRELEDSARRSEVQGVILVDGDTNHFAWAKKLPVPIATPTSENHPCAVTFDMWHMFELGMQSLAEKGCRSLGLITVHPVSENYREYFDIMIEMAARYKLEIRNEWIRIPKQPGLTGWDLERFGFEEFHALWRQKQRPDGLIIEPDIVAEGAITAMLQLQVHPPKDIQLVLHRNEKHPYLIPFPATLLVTSEREYAEALLKLIENQIAGKTTPRILVRHKLQEHSGDKAFFKE